MKKVVSWSLLSILLISLTGCQSIPAERFAYPHSEQNLKRLYETPKYNVRVDVLPLQDLRGSKNALFVPSPKMMIPFLMSASSVFDRVEGSMLGRDKYFDFDVPKDVSRAVVKSLAKSGLFQEVYFTENDASTLNADLILKGTLHSAKMEMKFYSYGLSSFGILLWVFGLKTNTFIEYLQVEFQLDSAKEGKTIWNYAFNEKQEFDSALYTKSDLQYGLQGYVSILESKLNDAVLDLDQKLPEVLK